MVPKTKAMATIAALMTDPRAIPRETLAGRDTAQGEVFGIETDEDLPDQERRTPKLKDMPTVPLISFSAK